MKTLMVGLGNGYMHQGLGLPKIINFESFKDFLWCKQSQLPEIEK